MSRNPATSPSRGSLCPIASGLDLLGDRWSLLVIRDLLLMGKRRFGELLDSPEKIPTNILADRLRRLEAAGVISKVPYQTTPLRHEYLPTEKGKDLLPVLRALIEWANRHLPGTGKPPAGFFEKLEERLAAEKAQTAAAEEP